MQASVKKDRQKWLGGSDIPIIMGISPFTTRYDLLLFKAEIKENDFDGNEYTEYGNVMESKIRDFINKDLDDKFKETKYEYRESGIRCHLDGENKSKVLEIKTTSQIHERLDDYKVYLVQLLFYMHQVGKKDGILAIYERPEDFNEDFDEERLINYNVNIDDYKDLLDEILYEVNRFKEDLEKIIENPLLTEEDLLPTSVKDLSYQILKIEERLKEFKELEQEEKELKENLFKAMVENNIKKWETPKGVKITRVDGSDDKVVMKFNEDKLKEEQPLIYAEYCEEKVQKGKSGYVKITL